jgi:hypothetical protein
LSGNLNFGVVTNGSSASEFLTISNTGNSNLTVTGVSYSTSGFTGNFAGVIAPGSSQQVTVVFTPLVATNYSGFLTVNSDATSGANTLPITAFGANPALLLTILTNGEGKVTPNDDDKVFKAATKISLKAVPGNGYVFSDWTGSTNSTNNPLVLII